MTLSRRRLLQASGAAILGAGAMARTLAAAGSQDGDRKRVLFFTKSSGFQHSVINRGGGESSHAERIFAEIGPEHGYEIVCSKDGRLFEPDRIDEWDAFAFYTTGDLTQQGTDGHSPMSPEGYEAFMEAIRSGRKGFIGMHCATDTFHGTLDHPSPYIEMVGGQFSGHGEQQVAPITVVEQGFPGIEPFGSEFEINDEWYAFRHLSDQIRVLMVQQTESMRGRDYDRPNYPMSWVKKYGDGKVFYTSMGHREDVWENPKYQGLLIGGLHVVTGRAEADFSPNVDRVTPEYRQMPG